MEWDKLWTINKKIIDPVCPRHTAVIEERRVLLTLSNGPEKPFVRIIPRHKKYEGAGEKATTFTRSIWIDRADAESITVDEEVTLMDWGNAIVKKIEKDQDGNLALTGVLHLDGSVKTTKLKLTWLPEIDELVKLSLMEFDYLITKKKVCAINKREVFYALSYYLLVYELKKFLKVVNLWILKVPQILFYFHKRCKGYMGLGIAKYLLTTNES